MSCGQVATEAFPSRYHAHSTSHEPPASSWEGQPPASCRHGSSCRGAHGTTGAQPDSAERVAQEESQGPRYAELTLQSTKASSTPPSSANPGRHCQLLLVALVRSYPACATAGAGHSRKQAGRKRSKSAPCSVLLAGQRAAVGVPAYGAWHPTSQATPASSRNRPPGPSVLLLRQSSKLYLQRSTSCGYGLRQGKVFVHPERYDTRSQSSFQSTVLKWQPRVAVPV